MTIHQLTEWINLVLDHHPIAEIESKDLFLAFHQKERDTPLGRGIMDLCGLPDEKETMERWVRAQGLIVEWDVIGYCWSFRRESKLCQGCLGEGYVMIRHFAQSVPDSLVVREECHCRRRSA